MTTLIGIANDESDLAPETADALAAEAPDLIPIWIESLWAWRLKRSEPAGVPLRRSKVGRNEPCPCGSGRKYKKCCRLN